MDDEALERLQQRLDEAMEEAADETAEMVRDVCEELSGPKTLNLQPAVTAVKKLSPGAGDVLAVMVPGPVTQAEAQAMLAALQTRVPETVAVMILPDRLTPGTTAAPPREMVEAVAERLKEMAPAEGTEKQERRRQMAEQLAGVAMNALLEELAASGEREPVEDGGGR